MNFLKKIKEKLSSDLKYVAIVSISYQFFILLLILVFRKQHFFSSIFSFCIISSIIIFPLLFIIGISRFIELKSKTIINILYLINSLPIVLFSIIFFMTYLISGPFESKENINTYEMEFNVIDKNGKSRKIKGKDIDFLNKENTQTLDSIIKYHVEEK